MKSLVQSDFVANLQISLLRQERCPVNDVEADEKDWNDDDCSTLDQIRVPPAMKKLFYFYGQG